MEKKEQITVDESAKTALLELKAILKKKEGLFYSYSKIILKLYDLWKERGVK